MGEYFPQLFEERGLDFLAALPETRGEHDGDCGVHPCAFEHGDGDCQPDGKGRVYRADAFYGGQKGGLDWI